MIKKTTLTEKIWSKKKLEPGTYCDKQSPLILRVMQGKRGLLKYGQAHVKKNDGKFTDLKVSDPENMTFKDARAKAKRIAAQVELGKIPTTKRKERTVIKKLDSKFDDTPTFGELARKIHELKVLRNTKITAERKKSWMRVLEIYAQPIMNLPVDQITSDIINELLLEKQQIVERGKKINICVFDDRFPTFTNLRSEIKIVMRAAKEEGYFTRSVEGLFTYIPTNSNHEPKRHKALENYNDVGKAVKKYFDSGARPNAKLCFAFMILTGTRTSEARKARWSEIDLDNHLWTIPANRMKNRKEHIVPLSAQAVDVLILAQHLHPKFKMDYKRSKIAEEDLLKVLKIQYEVDGDAYIFANNQGKPFSRTTLKSGVKRYGIESDCHGFRQSFGNWATDLEINDTVIDICLSHKMDATVLERYRNKEKRLMTQRRELMQKWATVVAPGGSISIMFYNLSEEMIWHKLLTRCATMTSLVI